jgi:TetR/AcrR family fatty acid metabolism transcriptional regulator
MPKIVNKTEKREQLVQAAIPIFAKHGFREAKMSDIAIQADVGKGTLYEYFPSKDELFLHAFRVWFGYFAEQMQEIMETEKDPRKQLISFYTQFFSTIESYRDMYLIYFDFWSELTRNPLLNKQDIADVYQSLRDLFTGILEDGVERKIFGIMDAQVASTAMVAMADGLLLQWLIDPSAFSIKDVGVVAMTSYLETLRV